MIRILPPDLVNKIAAGEVVERPASVVKELVENSIDAGAERIDVSLWGRAVGGIEVVDDGCGMDESDASRCLEHHATSKLSAESELLRIRTLGFRGEALSSIAAVSRLTLITKRKEDRAGVKIITAAGEVPSREPAASPSGTRVRVEELFYNVPARRKFLKSVRTEESLVGETVRFLALSQPDIAFRYAKDGRQVMNLEKGTEPRRVEQAFKGKTLHLMTGEAGGLALRAYLTPPEKARRGAGGLVLIVNRRCVHDRAMAGAVAAAHEGLLERGTYPEGVVYLEIPAGDFDVNVHPQKREVRFSDPRAVFGFIRRSLREALRESPWIRETPAPLHPAGSAAEGKAAYGPPASSARLPLPAPAPGPHEEPLPARREPPPPGGGFFSSAEPLAQIFSTYLLCVKGDELIVIDQHAAAERIAYEDLRKQYRKGGVREQLLLAPVLVAVDEADAASVEENEGLLKAIGLDASPAGPDCVSVRTLPAILGNIDPDRLLRDVVGLVRSSAGRTDEVIETILQTMACHGSLRAGRNLEKEEMRALLAALDGVDFSTHCPHGRPVYYSVPRREIESRFGRR